MGTNSPVCRATPSPRSSKTYNKCSRPSRPSTLYLQSNHEHNPHQRDPRRSADHQRINCRCINHDPRRGHWTSRLHRRRLPVRCRRPFLLLHCANTHAKAPSLPPSHRPSGQTQYQPPRRSLTRGTAHRLLPPGRKARTRKGTCPFRKRRHHHIRRPSSLHPLYTSRNPRARRQSRPCEISLT